MEVHEFTDISDILLPDKFQMFFFGLIICEKVFSCMSKKFE